MPFDATTYLKDTITALPLTIMLLTGIIGLVISAGYNKWSGFSFLTLLGLLIAMGALIFGSSQSGEIFSGMLIVNSYSKTAVLVLCVLAFLLVLVSRPLLDKASLFKGEFFVLVSFAMTGMMMMLYANDLIMIFIGIETMSIPFYVLAAFNRKNANSGEAGMKYFLIGSFATGFLLYGIALLYGASGSTKLIVVATQFLTTPQSFLIWLGLALLFIGFLFKVGAAPFHFWVADVYHGSPTVSSNVLVVLGKVAAFITFALVVNKLIPVYNEKWSNIVYVVSILSIAIGNIIALPQTHLKRILGFSSVAHAGYILMAFVTMNESAYQAVQFYTFVYGVMMLLAFSTLALLEDENGISTLDSVKGSAYSKPWVAAGLSISLLSLMGLPPFGGFTAKYFVFLEAFKAGHLTLVLVAIIGSMISLYYYLKIIVSLYSKENLSNTMSPDASFSSTNLTLGLLSLILLVLGIYPNAFVNVFIRF